MPEYIEREAMLVAFDRTISELRVKAGESVLLQVSIGFVQNSRDFVANVPAADVVEVVRCKDCRHFCPYEGEEHKGDCNELVGLESCVYEDDYCSYGEAKMDGKGEG